MNSPLQPEQLSSAGNTSDVTPVDHGVTVHSPLLGEILQGSRGLNSEQVRQVLEFQREHGVRFGEAVVALKLARPEDILWALSQQFHYPYAMSTEGQLNEELVLANAPFSDKVEAFRDIRSQLTMGVLSPNEPRRALAVLSPEVGDGKSFIVSNLAVAFSQLPGRTLLVDADLRTPRLANIFGVDSSMGLTGILAGRAEPNVIRPIEHLSNLYFLPAGVVAPNPVELLQRPAFSLLLLELLTKFDYVLLDTPAASHGSDARIIASFCGAALLVGRKNKTRMASLESLAKQLGKSAVKIGGVLYNEF